MTKTTLSKIAKNLGISISTVSKALKDYADVSEKTKKKVRDLAEKLDYRPNPFAQSLRNQESKIIGLIMPEIVHHFFANIILGVIKSAEKEGYLVITLQSDDSFEVEKQQLNLLIDKNVDGILVSLADNTIRYNHINKIISDGTPVVLYDKISKSIDCNKVVIDDKKAAFNATKYLIDSGCKRIAHIRGKLKPQTTIDRFDGYKAALKAHGLAFDNNIVFEAKNIASFKDGKNAADEIFLNHKDVDGIFAMTDLLAAGALVRLKELNLKIPEDISIIGFSNWFLTEITSPRLSTVDQPGVKMGQEAFNLLHEEIKANKRGTVVNYKTIEIPTEIIVRESTK